MLKIKDETSKKFHTDCDFLWTIPPDSLEVYIHSLLPLRVFYF
jgi:hypothetical protein